MTEDNNADIEQLEYSLEVARRFIRTELKGLSLDEELHRTQELAGDLRAFAATVRGQKKVEEQNPKRASNAIAELEGLKLIVKAIGRLSAPSDWVTELLREHYTIESRRLIEAEFGYELERLVEIAKAAQSLNEALRISLKDPRLDRPKAMLAGSLDVDAEGYSAMAALAVFKRYTDRLPSKTKSSYVDLHLGLLEIAWPGFVDEEDDNKTPPKEKHRSKAIERLNELQNDKRQPSNADIALALYVYKESEKGIEPGTTAEYQALLKSEREKYEKQR